MHKSDIIRAFRENRVGRILEKVIDSDGNDVNIVAVVFKAGTIGYWVADAYRITEDGRTYDGDTAIPVRLSEVGHMDDENFWEMIERIFSKQFKPVA